MRYINHQIIFHMGMLAGKLPSAVCVHWGRVSTYSTQEWHGLLP